MLAIFFACSSMVHSKVWWHDALWPESKRIVRVTIKRSLTWYSSIKHYLIAESKHMPFSFSADINEADFFPFVRCPIVDVRYLFFFFICYRLVCFFCNHRLNQRSALWLLNLVVSIILCLLCNAIVIVHLLTAKLLASDRTIVYTVLDCSYCVHAKMHTGTHVKYSFACRASSTHSSLRAVNVVKRLFICTWIVLSLRWQNPLRQFDIGTPFRCCWCLLRSLLKQPLFKYANFAWAELDRHTDWLRWTRVTDEHKS